MLKEEFAIYQDSKNNKTTIVIRNMSKKTFEKITELLLGDVKTVESVSGLEEVTSPEKQMTDSVSGMQQIMSRPVYDAPSVADADNTRLYYPEPEKETIPTPEQCEAEAQAVQDLWGTYDEKKPEELLKKFVGLYISEGSSQAIKEAAGKQAGEFLISIANNRRGFCSAVWGCRNIKQFSDVVMKLITQKGCGDGLAVGTHEYANALTSALCALSDEELVTCANAIAERFVA